MEQQLVFSLTVAAEPNGCAALDDVEHESGCAEALASCAKHVGCADVAAAYGTDVLAAKDAIEQVSRGDGPEQVRHDRDGDKGQNHNERV